MGAAIGLENPVVEVFNAQAQTRHARILERLKLVLLQRAGLALERYLGRVVPRKDRLHALKQSAKLRRAQIGRRAAAEIDEVKLALRERGPSAIQFDLACQCIKINFDVAGILVRVNPEVAELATLAAKRNVQVQAQRRIR